jgi:DNA topoisomerase I
MPEAAATSLTHQDFLRIDKKYEQAASVANLIYVTDKTPGITRIKRGNGFSYVYRDEPVSDEKDLARIKKLVIPPAWTNVWICKSPNGHIQVTGYDVAGRKQYRYHPRWNSFQHETKFHRLFEFGKALPELREKIKKDLALSGFPETKVIAMVLGLMERTYIRIGNDGYEKLYGSYGLTTMKNRHVDVKGDKITFSFKGKKGIYQRVALKSKRFARIIKQCKSIPGSELFQYFDEDGALHKVDSGQVNAYIKECLAQDFTTKDFRTWAGSVTMLELLETCAPCDKASDYQKNIVDCFKQVSGKLGNTVAVCKKYYVHPELVNLYKSGALPKFLKEEHSNESSAHSHAELILLKILKSVQKEKISIKALA